MPPTQSDNFSGTFSLVAPLKSLVSFDEHNIGSVAMRLHGKITVLFLVFCASVTAVSTYIADPIDCVVTGVSQNIMDTYCWIHSTFILPSRVRGDGPDEPIAHPGVGQAEPEEEVYEVKYYQWVWFALVFQALCFRLPRSAFYWFVCRKNFIINLHRKLLKIHYN